MHRYKIIIPSKISTGSRRNKSMMNLIIQTDEGMKIFKIGFAEEIYNEKLPLRARKKSFAVIYSQQKPTFFF